MTNAENAIDPAEFRRVLGHFPTGVTVITAHDDDGPVGLTIGSFASVSLDPALVAFFVGKESGSWARIQNAGSFCVNVLGDDQGELGGLMASRAEDKFAGVEWKPAGTGSPMLPDVIAVIDCTLDAVHEGGDHWIVVGRVQSLDTVRSDAAPLLFFKGGYGTFASL